MLFFRNRGITGRVRSLIAEGVGVRQNTWRVWESDPGHEELTEAVLDWVRDCMASMRRPHGVDQVALALSCRDGAGHPRCSTSLGLLDPADFYSAKASDAIMAFLDDVSRLPEPAASREISGALVCLGDIAFALSDQQAA